MDSILSLALAAQTLSTIQACLVQLTLSDESATFWPGHDGAQLDLSKFTSLKMLNITSKLFFEGLPEVHRKSVWDLLPLSLEEMTVRSSSSHVLHCSFHADQFPCQILLLVPLWQSLPLQRR